MFEQGDIVRATGEPTPCVVWAADSDEIYITNGEPLCPDFAHPIDPGFLTHLGTIGKKERRVLRTLVALTDALGEPPVVTINATHKLHNTTISGMAVCGYHTSGTTLDWEEHSIDLHCVAEIGIQL